MYSSFSVAIAIDFGTTFSGYAYCFTAHTSAGDIYKNTEWSTLVGQTSPYVKTPTYLLYKGKNFDSWGYKAKKHLVELRQQGSATDYHFFEKFKTLLYEYKDKGLPTDENGEPYLEEDGEKFLIIDLVADYLREISSIALQDVKNHTGSTIDKTQIRWCLTVPAIWDDAAKQMMEQAATKAGILKEGDWDAGRFMFALEPEAAAVYCLYVADKELGIVENKSTMMIVDCGGGTVDLTVHEIIREGRDKGLREVIPGSGAAEGHGGKDVDKNFLNYFAKILGGGAIDKFEAKYPEAYLKMMDDWETFKYGFAPDYERGNFRIPSELRDVLQQDYPNVLKELAAKQNGNSFNVWLTREVMDEDIFGPVVNNILAQVENAFNRISGKCDYLYLVGGFATSRFLQQCIKAKFDSHVKTKVLIPGEPGKSIMMGAASFARNPDIIRARRARLSYGVAISTSTPEVYLLLSDFLGKELPSEAKTIIEELKKEIGNNSTLLSLARKKAQEMGAANFTSLLEKHFGFNQEREEPSLDGLFSSFIIAGESLLKNHEVANVFGVTSAYQQGADILVYATPQKEVLFVDEPGVEKIGEINLKMPSTRGGLDRSVEVVMGFGDTKITVHAKDNTEGSDNEVTAEIDFLTTHATN
ncbi:MAG: Hsp70 family protein [Candidatus Parabeggiatoa sp.]|nr:Hsp70 family protein [Candidatus Parabeggiatoa sp.]